MLFSDLLTTAATWLLAAGAVWAALIAIAAVLEALTAGRLRVTAWVGCPPGLRGPLLAALGVALVAAPTRAASPLSGLPPPARPVGGVAGDVRDASGQRQVLVRPGDTLWRLAASRLPRSAAPAAVAALVERLHQHNQLVIGPDPDLIRPGQRLVLPPLPPHQTPALPRRTEENP